MPENDISIPPAPSSPSMKRALLNAPASPAKKQSKWTPQEDALIIQLRGMGKKWDDISKALPGRSPISCRLHYQNYLERRSEWDEDRKNHLAMLYERYEGENCCPMNFSNNPRTLLTHIILHQFIRRCANKHNKGDVLYRYMEYTNDDSHLFLG